MVKTQKNLLSLDFVSYLFLILRNLTYGESILAKRCE